MLGQAFYLREIGVRTPVSLLYSEIKKESSVQSKSIQAVSSLAEVEKQTEQCQRCDLSQSRKQVIFGRGDEDADLLFISAPPDLEEDAQGQSYLSEAGHLFDAMLASVALKRTEVYSLHIVQCAPPNHRDPKPEELSACRPWLDMQLDYVKPKAICVLGRIAAQSVLQSDDTLDVLRQQWHVYRGIPTLVSVHPAYLLRSPKQKHKAWNDFSLLKEKLV